MEETAQRHEHAERGAELTVEAGFETAESGENDTVEERRVSLREVIQIFVRLRAGAIGAQRSLRGECGVPVLVHGLLHAVNPEEAPFIESHFVDEMALGEVAGPEVGAGSFEEGAEPG